MSTTTTSHAPTRPTGQMPAAGPAGPAGPAGQVAPPKVVAGQPAGMVADLLAGDLAAGYALVEWLDERDHEPLRRNQATILRLALGRLVGEALAVARLRPAHPDWDGVAGDIAAWDDFTRSVAEAFGTDLYHPDDVIRFVSAVIRPPGPAAG